MALDKNVIIRAGDLGGTSAPWLYFIREVRSELERRSHTGVGSSRNLVAEVGI